MNVAIGGYLLMAYVSKNPPTIANIVNTGEIVKALDSAEECEAEKLRIVSKDGRLLFCIPALATINR